MIVAANQPYLFPYLGYFQLIAGADVFVASDSLQYESHSWINRNRLLIQGEPRLLTGAIKRASDYLPINQRNYVPGFLTPWKNCLYYNYARAPYIADVIALIEELEELELQNVAQFNIASIHLICKRLGITTPIVELSSIIPNPEGDMSAKNFQILDYFGAATYLNLPGGKALYDSSDYKAKGFDLKFLNPYLPPYRQQRTKVFHPALSILDVLANCAPEEIKIMINGASFSE